MFRLQLLVPHRRLLEELLGTELCSLRLQVQPAVKAALQ